MVPARANPVQSSLLHGSIAADCPEWRECLDLNRLRRTESSRNCLIEAKKLAEQLDGIEQAREALATLEELR